MKNIKKLICFIFIPFIVTSCATMQAKIPEKYNLDKELERVDQISNFRISGWEDVDKQSIILKANIHDYYLLVLDRPMIDWITGFTIGISGTSLNISPGFDRIYVKDSSGIQSNYIINKIYKLKGSDQVKEIKDRLRKKRQVQSS